MITATYVINLEARKDRRAEMHRELSRIGWPVEFFPAIRPADAAGFSSVGARGCFLSHLGVLQDALAKKVDRLIILEDDVNFIGEFSSRWDAAIGTLELQEWSIFYPGHFLRGLSDGVSRLTNTTVVMGAHFIMVKGDAIPDLVRGLEAILARPPGHPLGGPMHVDGAYSTIRRQNPLLATYAVFPPLAYQRASRTDIGREKWFDRISALRPVARAVRRLRDRA